MQIRGLSSAGRASALQAEGHRFEPCRPHIDSGEIAQLARACGSYPQCRGFKSPSRYSESPVDIGLFLYDRKFHFLSYKKDAPLRMRTRAKSRVLPDGNRARRECAPGAHFFMSEMRCRAKPLLGKGRSPQKSGKRLSGFLRGSLRFCFVVILMFPALFLTAAGFRFRGLFRGLRQARWSIGLRRYGLCAKRTCRSVTDRFRRRW